MALPPAAVAPLFKPLALKGLILPNRLVMAPMTRNFASGGVLAPAAAAYYRRRAGHGIGLILTEGTVIDHPASACDPRVPHFHGEAALAAWGRVVREVHAAGGRIMPQLCHAGAFKQPGREPQPGVGPASPSGLIRPGLKVGEPMTQVEIEAVVWAFAQGAADARRLGFDGVELHGGHGFLLDQFFWAGTNQRSDRYGGTQVQRTRFAGEVIRACRREVGPDFPILFRFSQWKGQDYQARLVDTPDQLRRFLGPLVDAGVDAFDVSTGRYWDPAFPGSAFGLAAWTRKLTGKPVIAAGSVGLDRDVFGAEGDGSQAFHDAGLAGIDRAVALVAREEVDLIAVGRALLADPAWARKVREGRPEGLVAFTRNSLDALH